MAATLRQAGAAHYRQREWRAAATTFESACELANEAGRAAEPGLLCALLLNAAQSRLQLSEHAAASSLCSRALAIDPCLACTSGVLVLAVIPTPALDSVRACS